VTPESDAAIEIRAAAPADLPVLERELPMATPARHREALAQQAEGAVAYLIAWRGTSPVGHGLLYWSGPRDAAIAAQLPGCPEIYNLGVAEALRSRGIGRRLLARLESLAAERGRARVGLGVALANARARRLYEGLGYRDAGAPRYVDRWHRVDGAGRHRVVEDECVFLVKELAASGSW
jgi:ribosomal protein S18 acetylase RimI-like enzyme